jgi:hypothetical protein
MRKRLLVAASLLLITSALQAQDQDDKKKPPKPKPDCLDGTYYDDGKLESGLAPNSLVDSDNFVMLFDAPQYPATLEKLCIAWTRRGFDSGIYFDVEIWTADGPGGSPGTLVAKVSTLSAGKVPTRGAKFYDYDVSSLGIVIDGPVYIGPSWDPLNPFLVYLAMDLGPKTPRRRAFHGTGLFGDQTPDVEIGAVGQAPEYRAFGIRAKFGRP